MGSGDPRGRRNNRRFGVGPVRRAGRSQAAENAADAARVAQLGYLDDPKDARTRAWVREQNLRTARLEQQWADRIPMFEKRIRDAQRTGPLGFPVEVGEPQGKKHGFVVDQPADSERRRVVMTIEGDPQEHVVLDERWWQPLGIEGGYPQLSPFVLAPSPSGKRLAVLMAYDGTESPELVVINTDPGDSEALLAEIVPGPFPNPVGSVLWLDDDHFLYPGDRSAPTDEQFRGHYVYLHTVGSDPARDVPVWENPYATSYVVLSQARVGRVQITARLQVDTWKEVWEAEIPKAGERWDFQQVAGLSNSRQAAMKLGADGRRYLITDRDAPWTEFQVVPDAGTPDATSRKTLIPQEPGVVLRDFQLLMDPADESRLQRVVVRQGRRGIDELAVYDLDADGSRLVPRHRPVPLPDLGSMSAWQLGKDGILDVECSAPTRRTCVCRFDPATGQLTLPENSARIPGVHSRLATLRTASGRSVHAIVSGPAGEVAGRVVVSGYGFYDAPTPLGHDPVKEAWLREEDTTWIDVIAPGDDAYGRESFEQVRGPEQGEIVAAFHAVAAWAKTENANAAVGGYAFSGGGQRLLQGILDEPGARAAAGDGVPMPLWDFVVADRPTTNLVTPMSPGMTPLWTHSNGDPSDPRQVPTLERFSPRHVALRALQAAAAGRPSEATPSVLYLVGTDDQRHYPDAFHTAAIHQKAFPKATVLVLAGPYGHLGPPPRSDEARVGARALAALAHHLGPPRTSRGMTPPPPRQRGVEARAARTGLSQTGGTRGTPVVLPGTSPPVRESSRRRGMSGRGE